MRRDKDVIIEIARTKAREFEIPLHIVLAIIKKESDFNNMTYRYEAGWKYHYNIETFSRMTKTSFNSEKHLQATSWGLMQVMGTVARELGFIGYFTELCDPGIGLHYGCKKLKTLIDKYSTMNDAIAAYNAGSPRRFPNGDYENQGYVDGVNENIKEFLKV